MATRSKKAAAPKAAAKSKQPQPCACYTTYAYTIEAGENGSEQAADVYQECGRVTASTFAPGHDARLKGLLIKLNRENAEYVVFDGGALISKDPMTVATLRGWAKFMTPAKPKAPRKVKVAKVKAEDEPAEERVGFHPVRVKLGRWVKDANIISEDVNELTVSYTDAKGNTQQATVKRAQLVG